jgi:hypothetical protein
VPVKSWALGGMRHIVAQSDIPQRDPVFQRVVSFLDQPSHNQVPSACLDLHGIAFELRASPASLLAYCQSLFRLYVSPRRRQAGIVLQLELVESLSTPVPPPTSVTIARQLRGIVCSVDKQRLFLEFDGKGAFMIDRMMHTITGQVTPELLAEHHLLDRLLVGSLALLLREWSFFAVHGFAAAWNGQAALLAGEPRSGKTTAGLALVRRGWKFLANDLSLLRDTAGGPYIFSCPERVYATAQTARLFSELQPLAGGQEDKIGFQVAEIYPGAVADRAAVTWLIFPRVRKGQPTRIHPMTSAEALIALLPHSMATWDRSTASTHFSLLERLARTAPAYQLDVGSDIEGWASLLTDLPGAAP